MSTGNISTGNMSTGNMSSGNMSSGIISNNIIKACKHLIVKLSCNNLMTHKKYCTEKYTSRLEQYLKENNYKFDETFEILVNELFENNPDLFREIKGLKSINVDEIDEYYDSEIISKHMNEIFWTIIDFIGIFEMVNLPSSCCDELIHDFWKTINSK